MRKVFLFIILLFSINSDICAQMPTWLWAKKCNVLSDLNQCIAIDNSGNTYITGNFIGSNIILEKYNPNGNIIWTINSYGYGNGNWFSQAIAFDKSGYIYITGYSDNDSIKLGNKTLKLVKAGTTAIFVAKFDLNGKVIWAKQFGGTVSGCDQPYGIAVSPDACFYVTGNFCGWQGFIIGKDTLENQGKQNVFIAKFDSSGKGIWGRSGSGTDVDEALSIATDNNGNAYITGRFESPTIQFGSYILHNASYGTNGNIFLVKYNPAGRVIWAKSAGGQNMSQGVSVATNKFVNIYLSGWFSDSKIKFGSFTLNNQGSSTTNLFLTKYDSMGNVNWATSTGGNFEAKTNGIATDTTGNVYITGFYLSSSIRFGNFTFINPPPAVGFSFRLFLVKYDTSGIVKWAISPYGGGNATCIGIDPYQDIYIVGGVQNLQLCRNIDSNSGLVKLVYCTIPKPVIKISGDTTFCQGDSVTLTSSASYGNLWSDSSQKTSTIARKAGIYSVTVTDSFCCTSTSDSFTIRVIPKPAKPFITLTGDSIFCFGDSAILTSSYTYGNLWSDSSNKNSLAVQKSGVYFVTFTDSFGCSSISDSISLRTLNAPSVPAIKISGDTIFCSGDSVILTSSKAYAYLWSNSTLDSSITVKKTGAYFITISDSIGCKAKSRVVDINEVIITTDFNVKGLCLGDVTYFNNNSKIQYDSFFNFIWYPGDGSTIINKYNATHQYTDTGTYNVKLISISNKGCKDSVIKLLEISPKPKVSIIASPDTVLNYGVIAVLTSNSVFDSMIWSTGETTQSIKVSKQGTYTLIVFTNEGCSASDSIFIRYLKQTLISIMDVITPNGDGINDYWKILNYEQYGNLKVKIFNRWGDELFSSDNYQNNWNGKYKGKDLPEGTYYYIIETENAEVFKGAVNILR